MTFSHNVNPTSDIHTTSNESTEMSKEIKKMLDDRCSSSEFRDFVANIDVDSENRFFVSVDKLQDLNLYIIFKTTGYVTQINVSVYTELLSNSEENKLTFDGPSRKASVSNSRYTDS